MASNCLDKNLLLNSGTSQVQRELEALASTYVHVDERTDFSSLIIFAKKYGAYLNFYSLNNTVTGDWQDIMGNDVAVTIATVGTLNTKDYFTYISNLYDYIATPDAVYTDPKVTFKYLFDFVFSIAAELNDALLLLPAGLNYLDFLNVSIGSKLAVPLNQLINYYNNTFIPGAYIDGTDTSIDPNMPASKVAFLASLDFLTKAPWMPVAGSPTGIITIPVDPTSSISLQAQVVNSSLFTNIVSAFMNGVEYIVDQTETVYIKDTLSNYPNHAPQYALYLAFLRLFKKAQDHLNQYTWRHLEFYYKKVLQLANNAGVADDVHLVFQLQKNTVQYLLAQNTPLKAGKDAFGSDLFYALTGDVVLNQASVQLLRSLCLIKSSSPNPPQILYASPTANSADGQGAKLTTPDQAWYPFGDFTNKAFIPARAGVGFAIASNLLYLNEGVRTITLTFNCSQNITLSATDITNLNSLTAPVLSVQLTGNKKWFDVADFAQAGTALKVGIDPANAKSLVLSMVLSGSAPPVVPYSQKIHGGSFTQALPMAQVQLNITNGYSCYAALKSLIISSVTIDVAVNSIQNLVLQNKDGKIDPSKPFKPFGEYPPAGSPFILGSKEIFQKKLTALTVNITWQDPAAGTGVSSGTTKVLHDKNSIFETILYDDVYYLGTHAPAIAVDEKLLVAGQWIPAGLVSGSLGTSLALTSFINNNAVHNPISPIDFTPNEAYKITSVDGFVQLQIAEGTYDIASYLSSTKTITVHVTGKDTATPVYTVDSTPATPPASPVATAVSISYEASDELLLDTAQATVDKYNARQYFFYHMEPFGFREMHPYLIKDVATDSLNLLPVFNLDDDKTTDNGGELWIGLNNTLPGETHSILFQVSEGSANPLKGTTKVTWYYMKANNWLPIDSPIDYTNNLSQSGLVILNTPGDETTNNTRADAGLLWIKGVVGVNTDSVCKIIAVLANAAKAQFVQTAIDSFTANIPAKTISKLAVSNAAIKQTDQPYPSFGGRPVETDKEFNQRVSERLRHKNRAVTAWDYERLVLQNFPQVHKVKCLNHTTQDSNTLAYSELKPGTVMVVTVPDLSLVTGANPLLPFTNIGLLEVIREFLEPHVSPFVNLEVCNPQFEGVQLDFCVTFVNNNANANYYITVLNNDIEQFLMPWAYGSTVQDIEFGGKIEKSALLNFVQTRPYVDYVTRFKMNQYIYGPTGFSIYQKEVEEAIASTARSILVPYSDPVTGVSNLIISQVNCNCND